MLSSRRKKTMSNSSGNRTNLLAASREKIYMHESFSLNILLRSIFFIFTISFIIIIASVNTYPWISMHIKQIWRAICWCLKKKKSNIAIRKIVLFPENFDIVLIWVLLIRRYSIKVNTYSHAISVKAETWSHLTYVYYIFQIFYRTHTHIYILYKASLRVKQITAYKIIFKYVRDFKL